MQISLQNFFFLFLLSMNTVIVRVKRIVKSVIIIVLVMVSCGHKKFCGHDVQFVSYNGCDLTN